MQHIIENYKKTVDTVHKVYSASIIKANTTPSVMVVSKGQDSQSIEKLLQAGHTCFGENRWQEIEEKWIHLKEKYQHTKVHFIGHLQTNKLKKIMMTCDGIQSIDRREIVEKIHRIHQDEKIPYPTLYIQVNIGEEAQKSGVSISGLRSLINDAKERGIPIKGLMGIPPKTIHPAPYFGFLWYLAQIYGVSEVSMGMSADYKAAIRLGSSIVRIGRTIFEDDQQS